MGYFGRCKKEMPMPVWVTTSDAVPNAPGFYPVVVMWDGSEGAFPSADYWDGKAWQRRETVAFMDRLCAGAAEAGDIADANDPNW
jgi:hypothetical protein